MASETESAGAHEPLVSVGMPTYNADRWLAASIESILEQTLTDFELVISDNASTDRTSEIARSYADADPRVHLIRHERNHGAYRNYNFVRERTRTPYFKWASSNDLCHPRFLEACVERLDHDPGLTLVYPRTVLFSDDLATGHAYEDDLGLDIHDPCKRFTRFYERIGLNNLMNGVIRTDALRLAPPDRCYLGADVVMMAGLALTGRFHQVPEPMFFRRMDQETSIGLRSFEARVAHYDPQRTEMIFQSWRARLEYLRAIHGAPISRAEKLRLWRYVARMSVSMRRSLWRDAVYSTRRLIRRTVQSPLG